MSRSRKRSRRRRTLFAELEHMGRQLPPPEALSDRELKPILWEVCEQLTSWRIYLDHAVHLSDRELYTKLWVDVLREYEYLEPTSFSHTVYLDLLKSWEDEEQEQFLRYYQDDREYPPEWDDEPPGPADLPGWERGCNSRTWRRGRPGEDSQAGGRRE